MQLLLVSGVLGSGKTTIIIQFAELLYSFKPLADIG